MNFKAIDLNNWYRKEHFKHFYDDVPCTFSTTVNLDITSITNQKLYPILLWSITNTVNQIPEFRTSIIEGKVGIFNKMVPAYTIFNNVTKSFTSIWTDYFDNYDQFLNAYEEDVFKYSTSAKYISKENRPLNSFDVSMIPWLDFTAFNLNIHNEGKYLLPIFTIGKFKDINRKRMIPLAIQVHHAVCDGYHVGLFVNLLQKEIDKFKRNDV